MPSEVAPNTFAFTHSSRETGNNAEATSAVKPLATSSEMLFHFQAMETPLRLGQQTMMTAGIMPAMYVSITGMAPVGPNWGMISTDQQQTTDLAPLFHSRMTAALLPSERMKIQAQMDQKMDTPEFMSGIQEPYHGFNLEVILTELRTTITPDLRLHCPKTDIRLPSVPKAVICLEMAPDIPVFTTGMAQHGTRLALTLPAKPQGMQVAGSTTWPSPMTGQLSPLEPGTTTATGQMQATHASSNGMDPAGTSWAVISTAN